MVQFTAPSRHGRARMGLFVKLEFKAGFLPFDFLAARLVDGWPLVKGEAAGGGGRRPAFTRVQPSTTIGGRDRRDEFTSLDPPRSPTKPRACTPDLPFLDASDGCGRIRDARLPVARRRRASLTLLAPGIGRLARERGALAGGGFSCGRGWISRRS